MKRTFPVAGLAMLVMAAPAIAQFGTYVTMPSPRNADPMGLLQRADVQAEIGIDMRQRAALSQLAAAPAAAQQQQLMQQMEQMRNLPRDQRRQMMMELQARLRAQAQTPRWQGELTEPVKAILRPEQIKRLHELDLQRRGPMAMADSKVADEVKVAAERRPPIVQATAEFESQRQQAIMTSLQQLRQTRGPRAQLDMRSPLSPLRKLLDQLQKTGETKTLAALTPEERTRWTQAQGKVFTFRRD